MPPDINHNDEVFAIKHDIENKKFILKLNDSAAEISVPYILDLNNSGDCIGYKVFLLKNDVKNKENDIFQVFDNGQRIGWIFTIQSLQSGAHDWAQNEHFLKIAYFAFKALLEKIDIKRSDLVGKCELKLSDCYDTDDIVFIVCEQEFDINFYLPSFYRYGYYFQTDIEIKSSGDLSVFDEPHSKNNICIKRISPFLEDIKYFTEPSFFERIYKEKHYLVKFLLLYQVIELLISKILDVRFKSIMEQNKTATVDDIHKIKIELNEISNEMRRINLLMNQFVTIDSEYNLRRKNLLIECAAFMKSCNEFTGSDDCGKNEIFYRTRNTIIHKYNKLKNENNVVENIKKINIELEKFIIYMIQSPFNDIL